ncbi:MAG: hypothetical protein HKL96_12900 [Phycisphaerales bacterium]|nr:hypothetical protein [Phycisphaerales bacterium]
MAAKVVSASKNLQQHRHKGAGAPIGKSSMTDTTEAMILEYIRGSRVPKKAISNLTLAQMRAKSAGGGWTIAEIVLHLMDSDLILADRMKRVIAESEPTLIGFNESLFARNLFYQMLDPQAAADLFMRNRRLMAEILKRLSDENFQRTGMHNERGRISLRELLAMAIAHLDHHMVFLNHKKRLLGKFG